MLIHRLFTASRLDKFLFSWNPVVTMKFFQTVFILIVAIALGLPLTANAAPTVIIESIEIGNPAAADEFIVLRNVGATAIDISKWSLQCRSNGSATVQKKNFNTGTIVQPAQSYVVANKDGRFATTAQMTYTTLNLVDKGGVLGLFATTTYAETFQEQSLISVHTYGTPPTPTSTAETTTNSADAPSATTGTESTMAATKAVTSGPEFIGDIGGPQPKKWPIKLSELSPNPITGEEFIEIANVSGDGIDVSGLWLSDASGASYALGARGENTILGAYEFRIWKRSTTRIALNDTDGEVVLLSDQSNNIIDRAIYRSDAPDDGSYMRFGDSWLWTQQPTPSNKNIFKSVETPPKARAVIPAGPVHAQQLIRVSAADSTDSNDEIVRYIWSFGDGIETNGVTSTHAFSTTGTYTITLDVVDTFGQHDSVARTITVIAQNPSTTRIAAAGVLIAKKLPIPTNKRYSGIVEIPPGTLGHRRLVMNGRTVEFTTDRTELPRLQRGDAIEFTAREIFKVDRMLLQVGSKDYFTRHALATAPPYTEFTGTILRIDAASFDLATTSTDFLVLGPTRLSNGTRLTPNDFISVRGVLLTDDADRPTIAVPSPKNIQFIKKQSSAQSKIDSKYFNLILLMSSAAILITLHLFLTRYNRLNLQKIKPPLSSPQQ